MTNGLTHQQPPAALRESTATTTDQPNRRCPLSGRAQLVTYGRSFARAPLPGPAHSIPFGAKCEMRGIRMAAASRCTTHSFVSITMMIIIIVVIKDGRLFFRCSYIPDSEFISPLPLQTRLQRFKLQGKSLSP